MSFKRIGLVAGVLVVFGVLPVMFVAFREVFTTPENADRPRPGTGSPSFVELSSPVDPDARFYWELDQQPEALIDLDEIISGGPSPDGIPPIDKPSFVSPRDADAWLEDREPVLVYERGNVARAYPIQILTWHEIVNDVIDGEPVAVTFCPLCNSAIVYSRRIGDLVVDFGTSGRLYRSDLVMYDRQTKSLWPQIEGRAVVGDLIGEELEALPGSMVPWSQFRAVHPNGEVLSRDTGFNRPYGQNPYIGYDSGDPFLFSGEPDRTLDPTERVLALRIGDAVKAYPFPELRKGAPTVVHDQVGGKDIVVFYTQGTASALDEADIAAGRDVGATAVFEPMLDGKRVTFEARNGTFVDTATGSKWNLLGKAFAGPLKGRALQPVAHIDTFWFAWAAFEPDTVLWRR